MTAGVLGLAKQEQTESRATLGVCEVASARLLTVEDKVVSLMGVGIREALVSEPKCSGMQSHR